MAEEINDGKENHGNKQPESIQIDITKEKNIDLLIEINYKTAEILI